MTLRAESVELRDKWVSQFQRVLPQRKTGENSHTNLRQPRKELGKRKSEERFRF